MVPSFQEAPTGDREAGEGQKRRRPSFLDIRHLDFLESSGTFSGLRGILHPGTPQTPVDLTQMSSDATIPSGFKESLSKAKKDVCQLWGAPAPRDVRKNQEGGGRSPLVFSTADRRKALKRPFRQAVVVHAFNLEGRGWRFLSYRPTLSTDKVSQPSHGGPYL